MADQRHGIAVQALANINRNAKKKPDPYVASDFIPWHPANRDKGPVLHKDPEVQSNLIKRMLLKLSR